MDHKDDAHANVGIGDGGPAFPRPYSENTYGDYPQEEIAQPGMSLLDLFALGIVNGILSSRGGLPTLLQIHKEEQDLQIMGSFAYRLAEKMLAARELLRSAAIQPGEGDNE